MKKRIIVLVIISLLIILSISYIEMNTVYLGSNIKVYKFGNKIFKIDNNRKIILKKVNVYKNGRIVKGYLKSTKDDNQNNYYIVSRNNKTINVDDLVASGSLSKINVYDISKSINEINEPLFSEVTNLLDLNITADDIMGYKKIVFDIDNDSKDEEIIYVSYNENTSQITKIFVYDNNNVINIVDYEVDYEVSTSSNYYSLAGLIDLNNDGTYEIIVSNTNGDSSPTYYDIYTIEDGVKKEIK